MAVWFLAASACKTTGKRSAYKQPLIPHTVLMKSLCLLVNERVHVFGWIPVYFQQQVVTTTKNGTVVSEHIQNTRTKFSHCSCQILNLWPYHLESSILPLSYPTPHPNYFYTSEIWQMITYVAIPPSWCPRPLVSSPRLQWPQSPPDGRCWSCSPSVASCHLWGSARTACLCPCVPVWHNGMVYPAWRRPHVGLTVDQPVRGIIQKLTAGK